MLRHLTFYNSELLFTSSDSFYQGTYSLSERETDMLDKLQPSISYLQKLGPEYIDQIFESSRWIFEEDADIAFGVRLPHQFGTRNLIDARYSHQRMSNCLDHL